MAYIPKPISQLKIRFRKDMERSEDIVRCEKCGSLNHKLYGKTASGNQRYMCLVCGRTFVRRSKKADDSSRKPYETWDLFLDCMIDCKSVRACASICGISCDTAFRWRKKVLECVWGMAERGELDLLFQKKESVGLEECEDDERDASLLGWISESEEELVEKRSLAPEARVDVERWIGIFGRNVRKYQLWQRFVREAKKSGDEKQYIAGDIINRPR